MAVMHQPCQRHPHHRGEGSGMVRSESRQRRFLTQQQRLRRLLRVPRVREADATPGRASRWPSPTPSRGCQLAQTHPGKMVCFLAYWYTFAAPRTAHEKAESNVMVMVVNQGCHAHALQDPACPANVGWSQNSTKNGPPQVPRPAIYEWYIPGCSSPAGKRTPWISGDTATRNLRYWARHGVKYVTYESQPAYEESPGEAHPGYPLRWPLFFPAARMMWDLDLTAERLLDDACTKLYGPAATAMRGYYHLLQQSLEQTTTHSGTWGLPPPANYLTPKIIAQANALLDAAQTAGQGAGPDIVNRIAEERAALGPRSEDRRGPARVRRHSDLRAGGHAKPLALRRASGLGRAGQYVLSPLDRDAHDALARALPHRRHGASLPGAVQILSRGVRRAFADGAAVRGTESGACGVGRACGTVALEFGLGTSAEAVRQTALVGAAHRTGVAAAVARVGSTSRKRTRS